MMIDRMVKWFRDFYGLDLNEEMARAAAATHAEYIQALAAAKVTTIKFSPAPYENRGVYYFYADPGQPSERMIRFHMGKAIKGTYRFDASTGTYYFNHKDKGTTVVIVFTEHGQLKRKTVTI